jgi:hypothetical protein
MRFDWSFPAEKIPVQAERLEVPAGTKSLRIEGTLHLPASRPEGGIITLFGLVSGAVEGARVQVGAVSIGLKDQIRLESQGEQQGSGKILWGNFQERVYVLVWDGRTMSFAMEGMPTVTLDTAVAGPLGHGGVIWGGQNVTARNLHKTESIPPRGFRIEGSVSFSGGAAAPPPPPAGSGVAEELLSISERLRAIAGSL